MIKRVFCIFILIFCFVFQSAFSQENGEILKTIEAEKLKLSNNSNKNIKKGMDKDIKFITLQSGDVFDFEDCSVDIMESEDDDFIWMRAKILNPDKVNFRINDKEILLNESSEYFKWIKLCKYEDEGYLRISVNNINATVYIDKFVVTSDVFTSYNMEYVIGDLIADLTNNGSGIKIFFSGKNLGNCSISLYRKMSEKDYILLNKPKKYELDMFRIQPFEKIKTIQGNNDLIMSIIDENPVTEYECDYYIQVENPLGGSLRSKLLTLKYDSSNIEEVITDYNKVYSFERYSNEVVNMDGELAAVDIENDLFLNNNYKIKNIPEFLRDGKYYKGFSKTENVFFDLEKETDVYIYISDYSKCNKDYYYDNGYKLIRFPGQVTNKDANGYTYFFHKRYKKNTGDAVYIKNIKESKDGSLSFNKEGNDLVIYFNDIGTELEGSEQINFNANINGNFPFGSSMTKVDDNLWKYIERRAFKYVDNLYGIQLENSNGIIMADPEWTWNKENYSNNQNEISNVVFFKEVKGENININFNNQYHTDEIGLEDYLIEDGKVFGNRNNGRKYGFKYSKTVNDGSMLLNRVTGYKDNDILNIEYSTEGTAWDISDYVEISYEFEDGYKNTEEMFLTDDNKYIVQIDDIEDRKIIKFNFNIGEDADTNMGKNWLWNFDASSVYYTASENNLVEKESILLRVDSGIGNDWKIDVDNGVYDIKLLMKTEIAGNFEDEEDGAKLKINNRIYYCDEKYPGIFELRDTVYIIDGQIMIKNAGDTDLTLFAVFLKNKSNNINRCHTAEEFRRDDSSTSKIYGKVVTLNESEIIKTSFNIGKILQLEDITNKYELVFNAASENGNYLEIAFDKSFSENSLITRIKLDNKLRTYKVDVSDYNEIKESNKGLINYYIRSSGSVRIGTERYDACPFRMYSSVFIKEDKFYRGEGVFIESQGKIYFNNSNNSDSHKSFSGSYNLDRFIGFPVEITGILDGGWLNILEIRPKLAVLSIEGDVYTNKEILNWTVNTNFHATRVLYKFMYEKVWRRTTGTEISEAIEREGKNVLHVKPLLDWSGGNVYSHEFIVDRTGPEIISLVHNIPEYINEDQLSHEIVVDYKDKYCPKQDIKVFYTLTNKANGMVIQDEKELSLILNKRKINIPSNIPDGSININIYAKDSLGNVGESFVINTIKDTTAPVLDIKIDYMFKKQADLSDDADPVICQIEDIKYEDKQYAVIELTKSDNITDSEDLTGEYKLADRTSIDFDSDFILVDYDEFITDGVYTVKAFVKDKAGNLSNEITKQFVVDRIPIDAVEKVKVLFEDDDIVLNWADQNESEDGDRNGHPDFLYYIVNKTNLSDNTTEPFIVENPVFKDEEYNHYNKYSYGVSVVDKYGNVSEETVCFSSGNTADKVVETLNSKTFKFNDYDTEFKVYKLNDEIIEDITMIKVISPQDSSDVNEYGLIEGAIFKFGPEGTNFKQYSEWHIDIRDLNIDQTINKNDLTVYYYNEINHKWETVETRYNGWTGKLIAKINHFSKYGIGVKRENSVDVGITNTSVSSTNGSVNANVSLFSLPSHKGSYPISLKFNSSSFNSMSKYVYDSDKLYAAFEYDMTNVANSGSTTPRIYYLGGYQKYWTTNKTVYCPYLPMYNIKYLLRNDAIERYKMFDPSNPLIPQGLTYYYTVKVAEEWKQKQVFNKMIKSQEIMNYENMVTNINNLDGAWNIGVPKLIKNNPNSIKNQYVCFEDGASYELMPFQGYFRNKTGRKFVYMELEDGRYLIKTENYKNYLFYSDGTAECIFYSNNPEEEAANINIKENQKTDGVLFSFKFDAENKISEVISYNRNTGKHGRILFEYDKIYNIIRGDETADTIDETKYINRLKSIKKQVFNGSDYESILTADLSYETLNTLIDDDNNVLNNYINVFSHVKTDDTFEKMTIQYERLKKVEYRHYLPGETDSYKFEKKEFSYYLGNPEPIYKPEPGEKKKIMMNTDIRETFTYTKVNKNNFYHHDIPESKNVEVEYEFKYLSDKESIYTSDALEVRGGKKYVTGDHYDDADLYKRNIYINQLKDFYIKEEDKALSFRLEKYVKKDAAHILSRRSFDYCSKKGVGTRNDGLRIDGTPVIETYFYYKWALEDSRMPFIKTLQINPIGEFSIDTEGNVILADINKYRITESTIDKYFGPTNIRRAIVDHSYEDDKNVYVYDYMNTGDDNELEQLINLTEYSKDVTISAGNNHLFGQQSYIKTDSSDYELIQKKIEIGYNFKNDTVRWRKRWIDSFTKIITRYEYYKHTIDNDKNDNEFLNPIISKVTKPFDENTKSVVENIFESDSNSKAGIIRVKQVNRYLDNDEDKKITSKFIYDEYDNLKEKINVTDENGDGLEGITSVYQYDSMNRPERIEIKGDTQVLTQDDQIVSGTQALIVKRYYDNKTGRLLAVESTSEEDETTKSVTLYFYTYDGIIFKKVNLFYDKGILEDHAEVKVNFVNEHLNDGNHISGYYQKDESSIKYDNYFKNIDVLSVDYSFLISEYAEYKEIIDVLKDKSFSFTDSAVKSAIESYDYAAKYITYLGSTLKMVEYQKDLDDPEKEIDPRYISFVIDTDRKTQKIISDTGLEFVSEYDNFGRKVKDIILKSDETVPEIQPTEYEYDNDEYSSKVTVKKDENMKIINIINGINQKNIIETADGCLDYETLTSFNYGGRIKSATGIDGIEQKYQYDILGMTKSTVHSKYGKELVTGINHVERNGLTRFGYSGIIINSHNGDTDESWKESDWTVKEELDQFGRIKQVIQKYDNEILHDDYKTDPDENITNKAVFDSYGRPLYQVSNIYEGTDYEKLDEQKYKYNYLGQLVEKKYYGWIDEGQTGRKVEYIERFTYGEKHRLETNTLLEDDVLISKAVIADYDHNSRIITSYVKQRGENWKSIYNEYDKSGNTVYTEIKILSSNDADLTEEELDALAGSSDSVLLINRRYVKYDIYQRVVAVVDFNKEGQYVEYNKKGQITKQYSGINFAYRISGKDIIVLETELGSPVQYEYNDAGMLIKQFMLDKNSNVLFEKNVKYDKYGRVEAEDINRYTESGEAKQKTIEYDEFGRVKKVTLDNVEQEITRNEITDPENIGEVMTTITKGSETNIYYDKVKYSRFGNPLWSMDRDNYKYITTYDKLGNAVYSVKSLNDQVITESIMNYGPTGMYLKENTILSGLDNEVNKYFAYDYDNRGRLNEIKNYDGVDDTGNLITSKLIEFYPGTDRIMTESMTIEGADSYTKEYNYAESGLLKSMIYPDGKIYQLNYNEVLKDGSLSAIMFGTQSDKDTIVDSIEFMKKNADDSIRGSVLQSYKTGDGITTSYDYDEMGRITNIAFKDNGNIFSQIYEYDKANNIKSVTEKTEGDSTSIVTNTYNRIFKYDSYNRLVRAEYTGNFKYEMEADLYYQEHDYDPENLPGSYENANDVNLERGANSVLITAKGNKISQFTPDKIRIRKTSGSRINENRINLYRENNDRFEKIDLSGKVNTIIENDTEYLELNTKDTSSSKLYKLNFEINDTDIDDNDVITSGMTAKLDEQISFEITANGLNFEYEYDVMGNIVKKKESIVKDEEELNGRETEFKYDDNYRLLLSDTDCTYDYDIAGKLTAKTLKNDEKNTSWVYKWNAAGNMIAAIKKEGLTTVFEEQYIYDEVGQRVRSEIVTSSGDTSSTDYVYGGLNLIYENEDKDGITTTRHNIYGLGKLQAVIEKKGTYDPVTAYYHSDIQGTTRFVRSEGVTIQENITNPYGQGILDSGKVKWATHDGINDNTGLTYMQARWMDNSTGRFISSDPMKDGFNWYAYCEGNPTTLVDPTGLCWKTKTFHTIETKTGIDIDEDGNVHTWSLTIESTFNKKYWDSNCGVDHNNNGGGGSGGSGSSGNSESKKERKSNPGDNDVGEYLAIYGEDVDPNGNMAVPENDDKSASQKMRDMIRGGDGTVVNNGNGNPFWFHQGEDQGDDFRWGVMALPEEKSKVDNTIKNELKKSISDVNGDNIFGEEDPEIISEYERKTNDIIDLLSDSDVAKKIKNIYDDFKEHKDPERFLHDLENLFNEYNQVAPDGFFIGASALAAFDIGAGAGYQKMYVLGYGWVDFVHAEVMVGAGGGASAEWGVVWNLNEDPKNYCGPFISGGFTYTAAGFNIFGWGDVKGFSFAPGGEISGTVQLQYYTRLYDPQSVDPILPDASKAFEDYANMHLPSRPPTLLDWFSAIRFLRKPFN